MLSARPLRLCLAAFLASVLLPSSAAAVIHPATIIDGPANSIVDVDGSAMAADGTGGIVYRKVVGGVIHVFAAPFNNGRWAAPVQVDAGNLYNVGQPAIAAGSDGRLLVVWVQPRNVSHREVTEYELMGASMQPGAASFGEAVPIDSNVGEPYTGDVGSVAPTLAMAPDGAAYVVYRVVLDDCTTGDESNPEEAKCRPGSTDKVVQVRVARFSYFRWSSLGAVNRAAQVAMRNPTAANAPAVGIDVSGNGVVAWQEPGSDGVARIWVRRLFGATLGNVLLASPEQLAGRPVTTDADAPAVAMSLYGEAQIAYRIKGATGSADSTAQLYLNSISSELGLKSSQLNGASAVAGATSDGLGVPSAAIDQRGDFRLGWSQGVAVEQLTGTDEATGRPTAIGSTTGQVQTTINPAGGGITAWPGASGGLPTVEVRQEFSGGAFQLAQLAGNIPGQVGGFSLGGSGQGDALLGWMQGPAGQSEVVGDFVQAPPAPFNVSTASGWVRGSAASVSWEASPDAVAGVTFAVYVDGRPRFSGITGLAARLPSAALGDGSHHIQVLATDTSGQQTMSTERVLKVDANPPTVTLKTFDHHRGIRLMVRDLASGVDRHAIEIFFGDGHTTRRQSLVSHVYSRAGVYSITAIVRDKVGNHATVHLKARVS